ncbi:glycosyltransferase family 39 protein [Candidatus Curtissbacteria bacterium]|nr:glycosyltransferase family 39 protein [Candidatus Curtissbacteria bacterium]
MIWLILLTAFILRLVSINQSLWLDEAININNAASLDLKSLVLNYSLGDFHPPLFHILLRGWILLFGTSEIATRIPSVILGVFTVYLTYLIGQKLFERKTALIAATLMATAPLAIYYSQEARMYMLAAALASLSTYFFISLIKKENLMLWFGFIISTALLLYTDYLPYLMIPVFIGYLFVNRQRIKKSTLRSFIPAFLLILILIAPWLIILPKQLQVGLSAAAASPAWAQVVGSPNLKSLAVTFVKFTIGRISTDNDLIYALLFAPVAAFIIFLFLLSLFRTSHLRSILWYWLFGPIFLAFIIAQFVPIFAYFRFIFVLPAFYLIAASAINTINWVPSTRLFLIIFLVINLIATIIYFMNPKFQREDWRQATNFVHANASPKTIVLFESNFPAAPFDYYNKNKVPSFGALSGFNAEYEFVKQNLKKLTEDKDKIFLFQYLSQITDPQGLVSQELFNLGFTSSRIRDFNNVGFVYEFIR